MSDGLILLVFLAGLAAFGWARLRRGLGMRVTGRTWAIAMAVFILVVLASWAYTNRR